MICLTLKLEEIKVNFLSFTKLFKIQKQQQQQQQHNAQIKLKHSLQADILC